MPVHPKRDKLKTVSEDDIIIEGTIENTCPGWDRVICLGYFPTDSDSCRPCESKNEAWVSAEFGTNKGICVCTPEPLRVFKENDEAIVSLAILLGGGYFILRRLFSKNEHKK